MLSLRFVKICLVASIALFFTMIAYDNVIDFNTNWLFVQHVLSMDTTFQDPVLMSRAITSPIIQLAIYDTIIAWQFLTALFCWLGVLLLLAKIKTSKEKFNQAKTLAYIGLFFGFLLYMVGFIIIGGEWFSMWQSTSWNGQMKAGLFLSLILFVMVLLGSRDF